MASSTGSNSISPQVRWKYSNLALTVAGRIVEAVSGESYATYVQHHIFDPLGMTDSSADRQVSGLAVGYGRRTPDNTRKRMPFIDAKAIAAATGITSTVQVMSKFVSFPFRSGPIAGSQILSSSALGVMHRVRILENDWTRGDAIGFAVNREKERVYIGHGGSYPGYSAGMFFGPHVDLPHFQLHRLAGAERHLDFGQVLVAVVHDLLGGGRLRQIRFEIVAAIQARWLVARHRLSVLATLSTVIHPPASNRAASAATLACFAGPRRST